MISNYFQNLIPFLVIGDSAFYLLLKNTALDQSTQLLFIIFLTFLILPLPMIFVFRNVSKLNRNKKADYFLFQLYFFIFVILFFLISSPITKKKGNLENVAGADSNLYFLSNPKEIIKDVVSMEEKERILKEKVALYPLDIDLLNLYYEVKRNIYFTNNKDLGFRIDTLKNSAKYYLEQKNSSKVLLSFEELLSIIPQGNEFNYLRYSTKYEIMKLKNLPNNDSEINAIKQMNTLKSKREVMAAMNFAIEKMYYFYGSSEFVRTFKDVLTTLRLTDFYINGFLTRLDKTSSFQEQRDVTVAINSKQTLIMKNIYFFNNAVFSKNVTIVNNENKQTFENYDYLMIQNSSLYFKEREKVQSVQLFSSNVASFVKNYFLIFPKTNWDILQYDIITIFYTIPQLKHYQTSIYYVHLLFSFYINIFFTSIILMLVFIYFSFHVEGRYYTLTNLLFVILFTIVFYAVKMYLSTSLLLFSGSDHLYFYIFDNLINLLLLFFAVGLYSSTTPNTKSENAYALFKNTTK